MRSLAPGFLLGAWLAFYLPFLPGLLEVGLVCLILLGMLWLHNKAWLRCLLGVAFAVLWVVIYAVYFLPPKVSAAKLFKPVTIKVVVVGLPSKQQYVSRFTVLTKSLTGHEQKIKLSWYYSWHSLRPGQIWQLRVKLKPIRGLANPTENHLQAWVLVNHIAATGYVIKSYRTNKLLARSFWLAPVSCIRYDVLQRVDKILDGQPMLRFIRALTLGDKEGITTQDWAVLQRTGTSHLIAISGLHIGLVAGVVFFLMKWLLRLFPSLFLRIPLQPLAALFSLFAAFIYSALAGFALPTQRALIMLMVFYVVIFARRVVPPWHGYCLALLLVLLVNPAAVLSASFWLSFSAVAIILYAVIGYPRKDNRVVETVRLQLIISLGLLPLTIAFFSKASLIAPLVNLLAIPWVTFLVVPVSLLASLLAPISTFAAGKLFYLAAFDMRGIWWVLSKAASLSIASFSFHFGSGLALVFAVLAVLLLLAPRGFPYKYCAVLLFLPSVLPAKQTLPAGSLKLTVLDVGQGLAVVVQTRHHALLYDAGEAKPGSFDMGRAVVAPFLQQSGIGHLDKMIISHGDNDHAGGAPAILKRFSVKELLTSSPEMFPAVSVAYCHAGQTWRWGGVRFQMLAPFKTFKQRNNLSCVLRILVGDQQILLPGDIEKPMELRLVKRSRQQLAATILVAPHHGSKSSSTWPFLLAVQPRWAVFSAGYHNRFHFPASSVVTRYQKLGTKLYNTAIDGAVSFMIVPDKEVGITRYRFVNRYWWQ